MEKNILSLNFKAPYYKIGTYSSSVKNIWLIFHGYGQLPEDFSQSFDLFAQDDNILIFPQGLSKFYLKGVGKQVGANWMTAYDRELDIRNYLNYLDQLYELEIKPHRKDIKLNLLGFSQGGHTVSRWINNSKIRYDKMVLWGSSLAYEITQDQVIDNFSSGANVIVIGDQDRFIDQEHLKLTKRRYDKIGFDYQLMEYAGGHEIVPEVLSKIV